MTADPADLLNYAALRVTAVDPETVGYWLDRYLRTECLTRDQLAAKLGTDARGLALLAVCRAPAPATFAEDMAAVAARVGVEAAALAGLIRQEQSVAAWAADAPAEPPTAGWLLAAHDADQPPGGDDDPDLG